MLLKEYVRMMHEAGNVDAWDDGLHPDLDAIQIYNCGDLVCEAPALEDRSIILTLKLKEEEYVSGNDVEKMKAAGQILFKSWHGFSLWQITSERF